MDISKKRLKVLILFNRVPYPLNNGGAIAMFSTVKEYAEQNFEVQILSMNTSKHFVPEEQVQSVFTPYAKVDLVYVSNEITFRGALLNLPSHHSYVLERFISKKYDEKLKEILKNTTYDIIHLDALSSLLYIETVRQYSTAKIFYRAQNVESQIWKRSINKTRNPIKFLYLKTQVSRLEKFELNAIKKPDVILPLSLSDEDTFRKTTDVRVVFLPVCIPATSGYSDTFDIDDIFFIGALDWSPNAEGMEWFLKYIWPVISKEFALLKFYIAGRKMPNWLYRLKSETIIPLGEVKDAKQFMLDHGIMIAPILTGSGIRIKIMEAMALGKVVIATTIAAEGLGATDDVNILIADSADQFIAKLNKCRQHSFRKLIGEDALRFATENYSESRLPKVLEQCGFVRLPSK